ncbi:MAG: putative toxin-antitoxin system toxin component, PIN family [Saprospiraceae bacterium]|nr:putative toxin-antitoxin system toxin component, PIN family [Saprospiraceae bacterium]
MKIVLDTNVLLTSISPRSADYWIFERFLNEDFILCVTTEILFEYEEIISREMGTTAANDLMQILEHAPNVELATAWFRWHLIIVDPDDNKFVDCAIGCDARYLVSEDKHFKILDQIPFPKVEVIDVKGFKSKFGHE